VVIPASTRADVNGAARRVLDARRVSFALMETAAVSLTGMEYGAITPADRYPTGQFLIDKAVRVRPCDHRQRHPQIQTRRSWQPSSRRRPTPRLMDWHHREILPEPSMADEEHAGADETGIIKAPAAHAQTHRSRKMEDERRKGAADDVREEEDDDNDEDEINVKRREPKFNVKAKALERVICLPVSLKADTGHKLIQELGRGLTLDGVGPWGSP